MKKRKEKILVAMSGGVDSSVAAALLVKQGHDVTGMFAVNYDDANDTNDGQDNTNNCWSRDYQDALRVAAKLGIKLLRLDFTKEYKKLVLNYMYREYRAGRTPNPDVLCNKFIKFGVWLTKARKLGFNKIATGHYAQLSPKSVKSKVRKVQLLQAKDKNKDQTYFLHQLTQQQLCHVAFPIGNYTKPQVRSLAKKFKLPTAEKEESMGICFVGEVPMKEFLQKKIKLHPGKILMSDGKEVGGHEGLAFYTIGQRIGLSFRPSPLRLRSGQAPGERRNPLALADTHGSSDSSTSLRSARNDKDTRPLYVVDKNTKKNELVVGLENNPLLYKKEIEVGEMHWISGIPKLPLKCLVRLRHRQPLQKCEVQKSVKSKVRKVKVVFGKHQRAVTPGQFAVFYSKGKCLGGGEIL